MTSTLLERIARALCRVQLSQSGQFGRRGIEKQTDKYWRDWLPEAHAALGAARDPSAAMIQTACGGHVAGEPMSGTDRECPWHLSAGSRWRAMVDAALGESVL